MTSGASATNSVAYLRMSLAFPAVQRMSICTSSIDGPTELFQALQECCASSLAFWIACARAHEYADPPHPFRLLRLCRDRPCCRRAAEQRDELAPPHIEPPPPESVHRTLSLP